MNLHDYQKEAHDYASYGDNDFYPFLLLAEEAGEACGKVAKLIRDKGGKELRSLSADDRRKLNMELGDVLWAIAEAAGVIGADLEHVAQLNLTKLSGRRARGKLGGSGDDR